MLSGVCLALARSTSTDPVLWRVLIAVLAVFGGTGLVLYAVGWLLIPEEGQERSTGERWLRARDLTTPASIGLLLIGAVILVLAADEGRGLVPLAVIGLLAYLALRRRQDGQVSPAGAVPLAGSTPLAAASPPFAGPPAPYASTTAWGPAPYAAASYRPAPYGPEPPWHDPVPRPPVSALGLITLCVAAVAVGVLLLARAAGADGITASRVLAAAVAVLGIGLVVGTRLGRARWLLPVGLVLSLGLAGTTFVDARFGDGTGDRTWLVTGSTDERLGAGDAVLDLRGLDAAPGAQVTAEVGLGELLVLVPEDLSVEVDAHVALGELEIDDGTREIQGGTDLDAVLRLGSPTGRADVDLRVEVGVGSLEVRRVAS